MSNLATAIKIAASGFEKKLDKQGKPYILHCIKVMRNLHTEDEELQSIAILHDCVEDKVCTLLELIEYGFPQRVWQAVSLLTHDKEIDSYDDYIKKIASNKDAVQVKLADLKHNTEITRLKGLTKEDFDRMEKYHRSFVYLSKI